MRSTLKNVVFAIILVMAVLVGQLINTNASASGRQEIFLYEAAGTTPPECKLVCGNTDSSLQEYAPKDNKDSEISKKTTVTVDPKDGEEPGTDPKHEISKNDNEEKKARDNNGFGNGSEGCAKTHGKAACQDEGVTKVKAKTKTK